MLLPGISIGWTLEYPCFKYESLRVREFICGILLLECPTLLFAVASLF